LSRPNSKRYSGNKIEIKIELTYAFSNRIHVWETGRSVKISHRRYLMKKLYFIGIDVSKEKLSCFDGKEEFSVTGQ